MRECDGCRVLARLFCIYRIVHRRRLCEKLAPRHRPRIKHTYDINNIISYDISSRIVRIYIVYLSSVPVRLPNPRRRHDALRRFFAHARPVVLCPSAYCHTRGPSRKTHILVTVHGRTTRPVSQRYRPSIVSNP